MPWKMIVLLIILVVIALFSGFNIDPVDVSIGFHVFKNVPLFLALFIAFVVGALVMLPLTLRGSTRRKGTATGKKVKAEIAPDESNLSSGAEESGVGRKAK